ncbi:uncharacterized protein STEHIDRAFT_125704 [Stereum hirsutum FP-91666 SS1]|uniref:uncharacterized protein n=1 Tax=Stereum hirsutum (strain FP-91666) TaxID=721885 RepID=UPI000444A76C|nr:uncharacterized protein STEHIDRAFT_125704 [Stereum hirsutum FP-91666 SS1]EIM80674.1 hypothetical protein STEHIDRAFT_125704 [Stereum hirsutum FP-91666 SS1]
MEDHDLPFDDRIDVVYVCDGNFDPDPTKIRTNFQLAVTIGTNYHGAISKDFAAKIQDLVAPGVRPRWFLDRDEWTWTKSPGLDKLRERPSSNECSPIP